MQQRRGSFSSASAGSRSKSRSPGLVGRSPGRSQRLRSGASATLCFGAALVVFALLVYLTHDLVSFFVKDVNAGAGGVYNEALNVLQGPAEEDGDEDIGSEPLSSELQPLSGPREAWVPVGPDPPNSFPRSRKPLNITVVYGFGAEDLTLFGYRALESILHIYPGASVRFATIGPRYATVYKWGNVLPPTQFQKYAKRGYDVVVDVMHGAYTHYARERPKTGLPSPSAPLLPGGRWWLRHKDDLLYAGGMDLKRFQATTDALPDSFLWAYFSLLRLVAEGGIHTDLSLFLVRPLPLDAVGYVVAPPACGALTTRDRLHRPMLMAYPARHPVLECVLKKFDGEFSQLNACIDAARSAKAAAAAAPGKNDDGLECVVEALEACHAAEKVPNTLGVASPIEWFACDSKHVFEKADADFLAAGVVLRNAVAAAAGGAAASGPVDLGEAALDAVLARKENVAMLLGAPVGNGDWKKPTEGSVAAAAMERLRLMRWRPEQVSPECRMSCHRFAAAEKEKPQDLAKAAMYCAPTMFVPGTQKGASTFLFHAITWHPQVLQPLRGAHNFKETGRYASSIGRGNNRLGVRMAAFPFIEEHENFASSDGTVTYMSADKMVPETIRRDNPRAKVVFALRDPVQRAWSDYRYLYEVYRGPALSFDDAVRNTLPGWKNIFAGHAHNGSWDDFEGIEHMYSHVRPRGKDPGDLVRRSLYYYQVKHWVDVFGAANVMVVDSDELSQRQAETIQAVHRFLGLCPVDVAHLKPENVNKGAKVPVKMRMSEGVYNELRDFYTPFNQKLYALIGRDLGWESHVFKPP